MSDLPSSAPAGSPPARTVVVFDELTDTFDLVALLSQLSALREENERLKAVMELAADDVTWHTRGSAFIGSDDDKNQPVALAINLNDVFGPCAESEPLALADAPELLAVFRHGGPDAPN